MIGGKRGNEFPNYFLAQKVKSKITQAEETFGIQELLKDPDEGNDHKKSLVTSKAGIKKTDNKKKQAKNRRSKRYIKSSESEEEEDKDAD